MNELLFLGTGAADWEFADKEKGFFRRNSAALLNRNLMLDCGEYIYDFAECYNENELFSKVKTVLITHSHSDHINAEAVRELAKNKKIHIMCDEYAKKLIGLNDNIEYLPIELFKKSYVDGYEIIPVPANHDVIWSEDRTACHYIINTPDKKCVFYGLDGAWFLCPTWAEMLKHTFDIVVLDCTVGDSDDWRLFEHNTIPMLRKMTKEMREKHMVAEGGYIIASHMAKTLHASHDETAKCLEKDGILAAFDGMKIEF